MLSSVLHTVNNFPVEQHPYIVWLIKGIFNSRPTVKLLPERDLPLVLKFLKKPPFIFVTFEISDMEVSFSCSHYNIPQGE